MRVPPLTMMSTPDTTSGLSVEAETSWGSTLAGRRLANRPRLFLIWLTTAPHNTRLPHHWLASVDIRSSSPYKRAAADPDILIHSEDDYQPSTVMLPFPTAPLTLSSPVSGLLSLGLLSHLYPPMHASSTESLERHLTPPDRETEQPPQ